MITCNLAPIWKKEDSNLYGLCVSLSVETGRDYEAAQLLKAYLFKFLLEEDEYWVRKNGLEKDNISFLKERAEKIIAASKAIKNSANPGEQKLLEIEKNESKENLWDLIKVYQRSGYWDLQAFLETSKPAEILKIIEELRKEPIINRTMTVPLWGWNARSTLDFKSKMSKNDGGTSNGGWLEKWGERVIKPQETEEKNKFFFAKGELYKKLAPNEMFGPFKTIASRLYELRFDVEWLMSYLEHLRAAWHSSELEPTTTFDRVKEQLENLHDGIYTCFGGYNGVKGIKQQVQEGKDAPLQRTWYQIDKLIKAKDRIKELLSRISLAYHDRVERKELVPSDEPHHRFGIREEVLDIEEVAVDLLFQNYLGKNIEWKGLSLVRGKEQFEVEPGFDVLYLPLDVRFHLFAKLPILAHEAAHIVLYKSYDDARKLLEENEKRGEKEKLTELGLSKLHERLSDVNERVFIGGLKYVEKFYENLRAITDPKVIRWLDIITKGFQKLIPSKRAYEKWQETVKKANLGLLISGKAQEPSKYSLFKPHLSELLTDTFAILMAGPSYVLSLGWNFYGMGLWNRKYPTLTEHFPVWLRLIWGEDLCELLGWIEPKENLKYGCSQDPRTWDIYRKDILWQLIDSDPQAKFVRHCLDNLGNLEDEQEISPLLQSPTKFEPDRHKPDARWLLGPIFSSPAFYMMAYLLKDEEGRETLRGSRNLRESLGDEFLYSPIEDSYEESREKAIDVAQYCLNIAQRLSYNEELILDAPHKYIAAATTLFPMIRPIFPSGRVLLSLAYTSGTRGNARGLSVK